MTIMKRTISGIKVNSFCQSDVVGVEVLIFILNFYFEE